jgi:hypothetical protein
MTTTFSSLTVILIEATNGTYFGFLLLIFLPRYIVRSSNHDRQTEKHIIELILYSQLLWLGNGWEIYLTREYMICT